MPAGRPTIHKNGIPLTAAEKMRRYRKNEKRKHRMNKFEWYTPKLYADAVRKVFGTIDLDPASSKLAQTIIRAKTYYTKDDDGLTKEWFGSVFLNPPYRHPIIDRFVEKLLYEMKLGHVKQAILLVHPKTDTKWFADAAHAAPDICFTKRIPFWNHEGKANCAPCGQAFLYFGPRPKLFKKVFKRFYNLRLG
jgi:DNA N-6-adenine-methyltransferase (Dam)